MSSPRSSTGIATTAEDPEVGIKPAGLPAGGYRGRFAPSPTGPLHLGSLLAAAGSWLDARAAGGQWLLRIEDIDPPRERAGASDEILRALEAFCLHWDGDVLYQSRRLEAFEMALLQLAEAGWTYPCACSRSDIAAANRALGRDADQRYPGTCRGRPARRGQPHVLRVRTTSEKLSISDRLQGLLRQRLADDVGDFVLRRREGLIAYQLAVVVDDAAQGITDVVRGVDLLDSTPRQLWLQRLLGLPTPRYMHLPVMIAPGGEKLSKQTGAAAVNPDQAGALAWHVLACLGQKPPQDLRGAPPAELWSWALPRWEPQQLAGIRSIPVPIEL